MVERRTIYSKHGDVETLPSVDCNDAVSQHPDEWSYTPWTATQKQVAAQDPTVRPYSAGPVRQE